MVGECVWGSVVVDSRESWCTIVVVRWSTLVEAIPQKQVCTFILSNKPAQNCRIRFLGSDEFGEG